MKSSTQNSKRCGWLFDHMIHIFNKTFPFWCSVCSSEVVEVSCREGILIRWKAWSRRGWECSMRRANNGRRTPAAFISLHESALFKTMYFFIHSHPMHYSQIIYTQDTQHENTIVVETTNDTYLYSSHILQHNHSVLN